METVETGKTRPRPNNLKATQEMLALLKRNTLHLGDGWILQKISYVHFFLSNFTQARAPVGANKHSIRTKKARRKFSSKRNPVKYVVAQEVMMKIVAEKTRYLASPEFATQMKKDPALLMELFSM